MFFQKTVCDKTINWRSTSPPPMKRWRLSASFPPPSVHLPREGRLKEPPGGHIEQHDYLIILSFDFTHTKKNSIQVTCVCVSRVCNSVCVAALDRRQKIIVVALWASYSVCVCVSLSLSYIIFALSGRIGPFRNQFFFEWRRLSHPTHTHVSDTPDQLLHIQVKMAILWASTLSVVELALGFHFFFQTKSLRWMVTVTSQSLDSLRSCVLINILCCDFSYASPHPSLWFVRIFHLRFLRRKCHLDALRWQQDFFGIRCIGSFPIVSRSQTVSQEHPPIVHLATGLKPIDYSGKRR